MGFSCPCRSLLLRTTHVVPHFCLIIKKTSQQEARLKTQFSDYSYRIFTAELIRQNSASRLLRLQIRFSTNSSPAANFWNDNFRLLVDGVLRAPISYLNEAVEPYSAKDGLIEFALPEDATQVILQLRYGREFTELPQFQAFLECGILAHGFLRLRCEDGAHEKLVAFPCKRRGFCPSCD